MQLYIRLLHTTESTLANRNLSQKVVNLYIRNICHHAECAMVEYFEAQWRAVRERKIGEIDLSYLGFIDSRPSIQKVILVYELHKFVVLSRSLAT